ncbi:MAG: carbonic anhydrase [Parerythrobacter sp.]
MPKFAELLRGYQRFRDEGYRAQRTRYDSLVSDGQHPGVMVIGCSDSRVDPAQIFDVHPGDIFVVRNVAALVPPYEEPGGLHGVSAALEFAVQMLKVRHIVVMGHGMCGGCKVALTQELKDTAPGEGGFIATWISLLNDAREAVFAEHGADGRDAERAMEMAAVGVSLKNLLTFPYVAQKIADGALELHGAFFAISEGVLYLRDEADGDFKPVA